MLDLVRKIVVRKILIRLMAEHDSATYVRLILVIWIGIWRRRRRCCYVRRRVGRVEEVDLRLALDVWRVGHGRPLEKQV